MFLSVFIFILYFLLLLLLFAKLNFVRKSGLHIQLIIFLFLIKIITGLFATWYSYTDSGDLLATYQQSLAETTLLKTNPLAFFTSLFKSGYSNYDGFYSTHSYWNDLRYIFMIKIVGILNLLTGNNIYTDVLIFNALVFLGQIAVFRVFMSIYPQKKWPVIAGCFLLPGCLFFLSCINKDSMFFTASAMVLYALYKIPRLKKEYLKPKPLLLLFSGLLLMFIIRNFFLTAALPAIFCYYLCTSFKVKPVYIFAAVFTLSAAAVFSSEYIMQLISNRQNEFLTLGSAKSLVAVPVLQPGFKNFLQYLPVSISMVFFRPFVWDSYNAYYLLSGVEMLFFHLLIVMALFYTIKNKKTINPHPLVFYGLFFSITSLIIIGYTIPYLGAVVRYKAAFLPLLITPLLCSLPVEKIVQRFFPAKNR